MKEKFYLTCFAFTILGLLAFKPEAIVYDVPEEFTPDFVDYRIDPTVYTQLPLGNEGTMLRIPKDAFVDLEGNVVTTPVTIQYKEYNNAADMAFSKIPMTYKGYNFNSSGMFEIQGQSNGEPVRVASGKSLQMDYHLAQKNPNTDFYRLNERSKEWELVKKLPEMADPAVAQKTNKVQLPEVNVNQNVAPIRNVNVDNVVLNNLRGRGGRGNQLNIRGKRGNNFVVKDDGNRTANTLLASGMDAGHTYPDIVKGLNVESFGVYNCDQVYRLPNRVTITATYQDEKGQPIEDLHVLSLIDLKYNGAFSFDPANFTCNSKGDNVLLLFDKAGQLYMLDKGKFGKMKITSSGVQTFTLKNVSGKIRNTNDLAKHLGINV